MTTQELAQKILEILELSDGEIATVSQGTRGDLEIREKTLAQIMYLCQEEVNKQ